MNFQVWILQLYICEICKCVDKNGNMPGNSRPSWKAGFEGLAELKFI